MCTHLALRLSWALHAQLHYSLHASRSFGMLMQVMRRDRCSRTSPPGSCPTLCRTLWAMSASPLLSRTPRCAALLSCSPVLARKTLQAPHGRPCVFCMAQHGERLSWAVAPRLWILPKPGHMSSLAITFLVLLHSRHTLLQCLCSTASKKNDWRCVLQAQIEKTLVQESPDGTSQPAGVFSAGSLTPRDAIHD